MQELGNNHGNEDNSANCQLNMKLYEALVHINTWIIYVVLTQNVLASSVRYESRSSMVTWFFTSYWRGFLRNVLEENKIHYPSIYACLYNSH